MFGVHMSDWAFNPESTTAVGTVGATAFAAIAASVAVAALRRNMKEAREKHVRGVLLSVKHENVAAVKNRPTANGATYMLQITITVKNYGDVPIRDVALLVRPQNGREDALNLSASAYRPNSGKISRLRRHRQIYRYILKDRASPTSLSLNSGESTEIICTFWPNELGTDFPKWISIAFTDANHVIWTMSIYGKILKNSRWRIRKFDPIVVSTDEG